MRLTHKLTEAQLRVLQLLSDKEFMFPQRHAVMVCERLESMGLAEGQLEPAVWDSRRGVTKYSRTYRRTKAGRKACAKCD